MSRRQEDRQECAPGPFMTVCKSIPKTWSVVEYPSYAYSTSFDGIFKQVKRGKTAVSKGGESRPPEFGEGKSTGATLAREACFQHRHCTDETDPCV
ncbi:hypothetical protein TNCV_3482751 [Trichonephila clavipes]|nr:hypothetical protein TNCV_3482751 [Trichonephila clavipes]